MIRITPKNIRKLNDDEIIVIGTNISGFHGAGVAGLAFRGTSKNDWRDDIFFNKAMKSVVGSRDRIGKWAVYGISSGFMVGRVGKSYGIITIKKPGCKRSISIVEIRRQVDIFIEFAITMDRYTFFVTEIGCNYAGYTVSEIAPLFIKCISIDNIYLPDSFINFLK